MVKTIIQVADIHMRNASRHDEYQEQLQKFIDKCQEIASKYEPGEVRILICGDLVHQKNTISNELITLVSNFIRQLSAIATVVIYSGNHDLIVNNASRMDTLTALFQTAQFDNAYYLDQELDYQSGYVVDENITWALFSIHNGYAKPNLIPAKSEYPNNWTVGLFHGALVGSTLNNGKLMQDGFDGSRFEDCDVVMAGDIHKRQVIEAGDVNIVYPGSLIQQTFGETVTLHGFAVWDVEKQTHEFVDLPNDYSMYDFEINSDTDIDEDKEILKNY